MGEMFLGELGRHLDDGNIWSLAEGIKKTRDFSGNRNENKRQGRGGKVKARSGMLGSGNSSVRLWRTSLQNVFSGSINLDRWLDNELRRREWLKCDTPNVTPAPVWKMKSARCEWRWRRLDGLLGRGVGRKDVGGNIETVAATLNSVCVVLWLSSVCFVCVERPPWCVMLTLGSATV